MKPTITLDTRILWIATPLTPKSERLTVNREKGMRCMIARDNGEIRQYRTKEEGRNELVRLTGTRSVLLYF
jgi:hypothetical protein